MSIIHPSHSHTEHLTSLDLLDINRPLLSLNAVEALAWPPERPQPDNSNPNLAKACISSLLHCNSQFLPVRTG